MWLHLWEPHGPYDATDWSRQRLADYDGFLKDGMTLEHAHGQVKEIVNSPEHVRALRTHYAGEVNLADRYLGQFLDQLDAVGELDNTVVIFTADHGQALAEAGRMGHGAMHYETVIRVPLIVADFRQKRGERVETRVGTVDISPTIADLAMLDNRFDYAGRSLMNPEDLAEDWPYFVEVALRQPDHKNWDKVGHSKSYDPNAVAAYTGPWKMTYKNEEYELFETGTELKVATPIAMDSEPVMADYLQGLIETFHQTKLDFDAEDISDEDLQVLKSLGYIQ
jgi:arylsulfatase A-like enzyme